MDEQQQAIILKLKEANNILVTVSANPSVDQLSAAIGLTILLNKLKKHATAVFSGEVPSTIDFLKPEETLEKNTDSLRDFIIALDKSKADKLRYKVEENIVKIFITPYKTSITQDDLDFSQGDFNVDVVLALGVQQQQDLDQAITAHGRILHDATVVSVNTQATSELGAINWTKPEASSLSELAVELVDNLAQDLMDGQIATALLTGIVAETERFSNEKTTPETMRLSAELMSAGANQQLVASELQQPPEAAGATVASDAPDATKSDADTAKTDDGTLEISHPGVDNADEATPEAAADARPTTNDSEDDEDHDGNQNDGPSADSPEPTSSVPLLPPANQTASHQLVGTPTASNSPLTANIIPEDAGDFGSLPEHEPDLPILRRDSAANTTASADAPTPTDDTDTAVDGEPRDESADPPRLDLPTPVDASTASVDAEPPAFSPTDTDNDFLPLNSEPSAPPAATFDAHATPSAQPTPEPPASDPLAAFPPLPPADGTLADIEQAVHSPHVASAADEVPAASDPDESVDAARDAVLSAINSVPAGEQPLPPKADVGAGGYLSVQDLPTDPLDAPAPPEPAQPPVPDLPFSPAAQPVPYVPEPTPGNTPADTPLTMPLPPSMSAPTGPTDGQSPLPPTMPDPASPPPPPVPPPMTDLPPFVNPSK